MALAGILTCVGALLDLRTGSLGGFFAKIALVGAVVAAAAVGYAWACDKCESYFSDRLDRLDRGGKSNRKQTGAAGVKAAAGQRPANRSTRRGRPSHV